MYSHNRLLGWTRRLLANHHVRQLDKSPCRPNVQHQCGAGEKSLEAASQKESRQWGIAVCLQGHACPVFPAETMQQKENDQSQQQLQNMNVVLTGGGGFRPGGHTRFDRCGLRSPCNKKRIANHRTGTWLEGKSQDQPQTKYLGTVSVDIRLTIFPIGVQQLPATATVWAASASTQKVTVQLHGTKLTMNPLRNPSTCNPL